MGVFPMESTEMVPHSAALDLARAWEVRTKRIRELVIELGAERDALNAAFSSESMYAFRIDLDTDASDRGAASAKYAEELIDGMRRNAWKVLIEKLGIRKLMSAKRAQKLDEQLNGHRRSYGSDPIEPLPEITEDTIISVTAGFVNSAEEFLTEAIHEEYDFWKPSKYYHDYKRNDEFKLARKIIRPYVIQHAYNGHFQPNYNNQQHVRALDQIFHLLAGRGTLPGYDSPLVEAIRGTRVDEGKGETDFFKFRAYNNGNIHLEFKRVDLLDKFNAIAGRNRLPKPE